MPIDFPNSPTNGDTFTVGTKTWLFDGTAWSVITGAAILESGSVESDKLANSAVITSKINNGAVTNDKLADSSVTTAKIAAGAVNEEDIANNAVTQAKLHTTLSGITICTSSTKPGSPFTGQTIFETDTSKMKVWLGSSWSAGAQHMGVPTSVEYLVVGGGGGGQSGIGNVRLGAGGGGGGQTSGNDFNPTSGVTYTVTVGGGGVSNGNGIDSTIAGTGLTTLTGGGGNTGTGNSIPTVGGTGGTGTTTGSAGGAGNLPGAAGVAGTANSITGTSVTRSGGGGGSRNGAGGAGGGGTGGDYQVGVATAGSVNTGGGGGGGEPIGSLEGAAGGSGVVIIRTPDTFAEATTVGATVTNPTGFYVYTFNASGSITF